MPTYVLSGSNSNNHELTDLCDSLGVPCLFYRNEGDVLGRFAFWASQFDVERVIRVNADCPLIDPTWIRVIVEHVTEYADYVGFMFRDGRLAIHSHHGKCPEMVSQQALLRADGILPADDPQREHVTQAIYGDPRVDARYCRIIPMEHDGDWAIDTPEDLERVEAALNGENKKVNLYETAASY